MSEAPKTIWACKEFGSVDWDAGTFCTVDDGGEEYTLTSSVSAQLKAADAMFEAFCSKPFSADKIHLAVDEYRKAKEQAQ